jgi:F-type H+-transporting ATPase subunit b
MSVHDYLSPIFIAQLVDFIVFVGVIAFLYNKYIATQLVRYQEALNKSVEDAVAQRAAEEKAIEAARNAIEQAKRDAARMVEVGQATAARLLVDERAAAQEHARRVLTHAAGELERERYRVRRELLEETVERATSSAREIVKTELSPDRQQELVERTLSGLEHARA